VPPRPAASVFYGDSEVPQNGTIDAGEVYITLSKDITITIKNGGELPLTLETENITITGSNAAAFSKLTNPGGTISAGGQTSFIVECKPAMQGENDAILTIPTNDNSRNPLIVYLKVTALKGSAVMGLSQNGTNIAGDYITSFDFERVELGGNRPLVFTIKNVGNIALELTGNPAVVSSNVDFTVLFQPVNTTINPRSTVSFILQYTPTAEKEDSGIITIFNNSDAMIFVFSVKGTGYIKKPQITVKQGNTVIDQHGQFNFGTILNGTEKDITFTIENSGEADLTFDTAGSNTVNLTDNVNTYYSVITQPFVTTVITPGNTATFIIRFNPSIIGNNYAAIAQIKTNSRTDADFSFWLIGNSSNTYQIGDTGPGGGLIFYAQGGQYKECSGELGSTGWAQAVETAGNYNGGGFTNWRLPDRGELDLMYRNLYVKSLGGFLGGYYWSSEENGLYSAWSYYFTTGLTYGHSSNSIANTCRVRAVRSFAL
jgi:hypothetical protein